jgi:hypothetical protein
MNFIQRLFTSKKKLLSELEKTKLDLDECGNKLLEKQEHINTTNAYWKKKMHEAVKTPKPPRKKKEL